MITAERGCTLRKAQFVNSWHVNAYESAAMWRLYLKGNEGVSVQSTLDRLKRSFTDPRVEACSVNIGLIKYIDYETELIPESNALYPVFHKRKSYEHEREIRAVITDLRFLHKTDKEPDEEIGRYVNVDLGTLTDRVYVAPATPDWFRELVQSVATMYGLGADKVIVSSLDQRPLY